MEGRTSPVISIAVGVDNGVVGAVLVSEAVLGSAAKPTRFRFVAVVPVVLAMRFLGRFIFFSY